MTAPVISGLQWLTTDCLHFVRLELSARSGLLSMDVEVKVTSASVKIAAIRESTKTTLSLLVRTFVTIVMLPMANVIAGLFQTQQKQKRDEWDQVRHGDATPTQREP